MEINAFSHLISLLQIDPDCKINVRSLQATPEIHHFYFSPDAHTLMAFETNAIKDQSLVQIIKESLLGIRHFTWIWQKDGTWMMKSNRESPVDLIQEKEIPFYLYVPPQEKKMDVSDFIELIAHLRSTEGCPWDRKQTHQSLRTNLLEETYEVLEAIDAQDDTHLQEELGDLLLQIVLHSQIAEEEGSFDFGNVVHDVFDKIRNRHPHVFGKTHAVNVGDVMTNWENIKAKEREIINADIHKSILESIPDQLPALSVAQKYQERAARVGFDWEDITPVFEKVLEEIEEIRGAENQKNLEEELGDLLFAVVNLVRWNGLDAESALRLTNKKFRKRFGFIEKKISDNGKVLSDASLSEMDDLWNQSKLDEH